MDEYEKLRSLLINDEQQQILKLEEALESLFEETRDPEQVIDRIAPLISGIFSQTIQKNKAEFIEIFSPLISDLLKKNIQNSSSEIAKIMAPVMGMAIKDQVKNQKDEIVDALYPVMGNMISKFVAESFKEMLLEINQKVQSTFSIEMLKRKITAKIKGVSETELLLQSASHSYIIQSVFLIHKETGILISERSASGEESIEPEMVASMLTAIRSFANDWISKNSDHFELNEIEFGNSTIRLEVAGCCYLAIVLKGNINRAGQLRITNVLEQLVEKYSECITSFDGDRETLPLEDINAKIDSLLNYDDDDNKEPLKEKKSFMIWIILFLIIGGISWGMYNSYISYSAEKKARSLIYHDPKLNLYAIDVEVDGSSVSLNGRLPAKSLHNRLLMSISHELPEFSIDDQTVITEVILTNEQTFSMIKAIIDMLNYEDGNMIQFKFEDGVVKLDGVISENSLHEALLRDISNIGGVESVISTLQEHAINGTVELFYAVSKSAIDTNNKIIINNWFKSNKVKSLLKLYKNMDLLIIGYTDMQGSALRNISIATKRSQNVMAYLIKKGVPKNRLTYVGVPRPPYGIIDKTHQSGRCVQIKWVKR